MNAPKATHTRRGISLRQTITRNEKTIIHKFVLAVSQFEPGNIFISHPKIEEELIRERIPLNRPIGHIVVRVHPKKKEIEGMDFNPIGSYPITQNRNTFHQTALDTWINFRVERVLNTLYPKYDIYEIPGARPFPAPHSRRREPAQRIPIKDAYTDSLIAVTNILRREKGKDSLQLQHIIKRRKIAMEQGRRAKVRLKKR